MRRSITALVLAGLALLIVTTAVVAADPLGWGGLRASPGDAAHRGWTPGIAPMAGRWFAQASDLRMATTPSASRVVTVSPTRAHTPERGPSATHHRESVHRSFGQAAQQQARHERQARHEQQTRHERRTHDRGRHDDGDGGRGCCH